MCFRTSMYIPFLTERDNQERPAAIYMPLLRSNGKIFKCST